MRNFGSSVFDSFTTDIVYKHDNVQTQFVYFRGGSFYSLVTIGLVKNTFINALRVMINGMEGGVGNAVNFWRGDLDVIWDDDNLRLVSWSAKAVKVNNWVGYLPAPALERFYPCVTRSGTGSPLVTSGFTFSGFVL